MDFHLCSVCWNGFQKMGGKILISVVVTISLGNPEINILFSMKTFTAKTYKISLKLLIYFSSSCLRDH